MVAKVNGAIAAGSFIGHDIDHWSVTGLDCTSAAVATALFDTIETKATVVIIGALGDGTATPAVATAFAVESPNSWTKATLEAATTGATFTAVTY